MRVQDLVKYLESFGGDDVVHLREWSVSCGQFSEDVQPLIPNDLSSDYRDGKYIILIG